MIEPNPSGFQIDNLILVLILLTSGFNATMRVMDKLIEKRKNGRNNAGQTATQVQKVEVGKNSSADGKPGFAPTCIDHTTSIAVLQNICKDIKTDLTNIDENVGKIFDRIAKL